jgi:hypothetical protein
MKPRSIVLFFSAIALALPQDGGSAVPRRKLVGAEPVELPLKEGSAVGVLALSPSTLEAARRTAEERKWISKEVKGSAGGQSVIIVVVRSSLRNPLAAGYEKFLDLRRAAAACPNHNGPFVHVYVYAFVLDEGLYQNLDHWSFKADQAKKEANKAPEPTLQRRASPCAVMPRAGVPEMKSPSRIESCFAA